jgi:glycerophosphoryl diester phosphodiesterase
MITICRMDAIEIIAHRGSSYHAPENTRAAVELAWQEGADAVEGDFRLSADGHIVALHDATLKRTAGIDRRVVECSLKEIRQFDVGSWKGPKFAGESVPTLAELLAMVPVGKRFYVEVKCGAEIAEPLRRLLATGSAAPDQIVLISLDAQVLQQLKAAIPQCQAVWVVEFNQPSPGNWSPTLAEIRHTASAIKADGLDLLATGPFDAQFVTRAQSAGLGICTWTVDDLALARRLIDLGVDGITTNRPGWLREQLHLSSRQR